MAKLDGTHLALGVVAAVAAAGAVASRSRGSRALSSMTTVVGLDPSQPWKAMVGAAKGGPSQEKWKAAFRNYPLDIELHVVGNRRDEETWLRKVRRPAPGKLKIVVEARTFDSDPQMARLIEAGRKQAPSDAFALMTPFTVLHRIFDSSYTNNYSSEMPVLALTEELGSVVVGGFRGSTPYKYVPKELFEWAMEDCTAPAPVPQPVLQPQAPTRAVLLSDFIKKRGSSSRREQDERDAKVDTCVEAMMARWTDASSVYDESQDLLLGGGMFIEETDERNEAFEPYREKSEVHARVFSRIVASLTCPTAAGRLLRLTSYGQAMADCYATWAVANRNPLVKLTVDDLRKFSVDKQIDRWLKSIGGQQNTTDVAIKRYREKLEQVAVPVLRWVAENDKSSAFAKAIAAGKKLHSQREPLIHACNEVLSLQRVLAI